MTTPNDLLFFYMLGTELQNDLFHHLSRDGGETDWHVVSQALLFLFLKIGLKLAFLQSLSISHHALHYFSKMMESGLETSASSLRPVSASHQEPKIYGC